MTDSNFTIGFIGLGLIGGSIAKGIRRVFPNYTLIGMDENPDTIKSALEDGIIDSIATDCKTDFAECNYVFLCAPVQYNVMYLKDLKGSINENCILTDVGSVKEEIHLKIEELGMEEYFIGGHPMVGSEKAGFSFSSDRLVENAYYFITPTKKVSEQRVKDFTNFIEELGALTIILDYKQHDAYTAAISHVPHIMAAELVHIVSNMDTDDGILKQLAAGGFKDITRIASSSPEMWEQICSANSENILSVLDEYINSLIEIKFSLAEHNTHCIHDLFETSRDYRNSISDSGSGPIPKAYSIYCDMVDEAGGIAALATILATNGISIKNIGIVHNREFEEAVLHVEFYEEMAKIKAAELLRKYRYTIYER